MKTHRRRTGITRVAIGKVAAMHKITLIFNDDDYYDDIID